jgi:hypothetical protein
LLIEFLALSPISGPDDSHALVADGETHGQDSAAYVAEREIAKLASAMRSVFGEHQSGIIKDLGCELEGYAVLGQVVAGLPLVPFELHCGTILWRA